MFVFVLEDFSDLIEKESVVKVLGYMGFKSGEKFVDVVVNYVFIGFCINGCIEDLCVVVYIVKNGKVVDLVMVIVVSGFGNVKC